LQIYYFTTPKLVALLFFYDFLQVFFIKKNILSKHIIYFQYYKKSLYLFLHPLSFLINDIDWLSEHVLLIKNRMIQEVLIKVLNNQYSNNEVEKKRLVEALYLAEQLLTTYNVSNLEIGFTKRKDILGFCSDTGDTIKLQLNHVLHSDIEKIKETILHEIAHAITDGEGHSIEWQKKALELGLSYKHLQRYKKL